MGVKTIVSCDRCGTEIRADRTALDVRCGPILKTTKICFDLCPDCIPDFLSWFRNSDAVTPIEDTTHVRALEWIIERFREKKSWTDQELISLASRAGLSRDALFSPSGINALSPEKLKRKLHSKASGERYWTWDAQPGWPPADQGMED